MSEWFKEHDWKSCDAGTYPEVQILFSAPRKRDMPKRISLFRCTSNLEEDSSVGAGKLPLFHAFVEYLSQKVYILNKFRHFPFFSLFIYLTFDCKYYKIYLMILWSVDHAFI